MSIESAHSRALANEAHVIGQTHDWTEKYDSIFSVTDFPTGKILDVGSYNGRLANWLLKKVGENHTVSLDIRQLDPTNNLVRGDAFALPFADNSFDQALSFGSFSQFDYSLYKKRQGLLEMMRVARKVIVWPIPPELIQPADNNYSIAEKARRLLKAPRRIDIKSLEVPALTNAALGRKRVLLIQK